MIIISLINDLHHILSPDRYCLRVEPILIRLSLIPTLCVLKTVIYLDKRLFSYLDLT